MSTPIDHTGKTYGCLTVLSKAKSRVVPSGGTIAMWNVRCVCGHEKEIRAQSLKRKHVSCDNEKCSQKWGAPTIVKCEDCGSDYLIQRRTKTKVSRCRKCSAKLASRSAKGIPAKNRLPHGIGGFNLLLGAYKKRANDKGRLFSLTNEQFGLITKCNCYYCGRPPSQEIKTRKGMADPYVYNGIDRIDSRIGYVIGNVVACCSICNYMKQELSVDDFLAQVDVIYKHMRERGLIP